MATLYAPQAESPHVLPQEDLRRARLSADRPCPARGHAHPSASDCHARPARRAGGERLLRSGARFAAKAMVLVEMQVGAASEVEGAAARAWAGVRAAVEGDRLPRGDRGSGGTAQARLCARA